MNTPPAPATVGRFRILESIGQGGMGRVFLAEDPVLGRKLAVKLLPPEVQNDPERRERLVQEARAASALNHPNILVVHDLGEADGNLYVAMELVDGQTLRAWLDSALGSTTRTHPPEASLRLLRQAARGLAAAHGAGIVHRDLKPENLMVRADGILKILDFGLAQTASLGPQDATMPGNMGSPGSPGAGLVGTVPYMSPEQVLGQAAETASDLFSLGVVLYEALTGVHPFASAHSVDTLQRIVHEMPAPPSSRNPALGPQVDFVLSKVLAKDPARRHGSARDLENDITALEESVRGSRPGSSPGVAAASAPPGPGAGAPDPGIRAVAVLPFKNIGGSAELGYLGMGLADAVITQLASSPDVIVRATSTVAGYENKPVDPRRVGEELQADAVLDASFQKVADRLRVTARLVESATGRALWAGKVEVRSEDVFELQDRVAQSIAQVFEVQGRVEKGVAGQTTGSDSQTGSRASSPAAAPAALSRDSDSRNAPVARAAAGGPGRGFVPSPAAYDNYLRGMEATRTWSLEGWKRAIDHFEEAVRLEPRFARAWAMLGEVYQSMAASGWDVNETWFERAEEALNRSQAIDPEEGYAYYLSGSLHIARGRPAEAWKDLQKALAKMPHFWVIYHYMSYACRISDQLEQAIELEKRAASVEPNVPWAYTPISRMNSLLGNRVEAWEWLERGRMRAGPHMMFEFAEMGLLMDEERWQEIRDKFADRPNLEEMVHRAAPLALAYLRTGSPERGEALIRNMESSAEVDMDASALVAMYWAWAGDADRAFHFLQRGEELGFRILRVLENPQYFGPIHDDPRWKPYIEGVRAKVEELKRVLVET